MLDTIINTLTNTLKACESIQQEYAVKGLNEHDPNAEAYTSIADSYSKKIKLFTKEIKWLEEHRANFAQGGE